MATKNISSFVNICFELVVPSCVANIDKIIILSQTKKT